MNEETLDQTPAEPIDAAPPEAPPASEPEPIHEPTMDETIRETWAKLHPPEQARNERGQFARNAPEGEPPDEPASEPEPAIEAKPEPRPHDVAPNTWRKELQA